MKRRTNRLVSVLAAFSVAASLGCGAVAAADFPDMPDNWSTAAITYAVENDLIRGMNGMINPDGRLTRAEMATVINRAFGATAMATISFPDVKADAWYYPEVAKAVRMATFFGDAEGTFRPDDAINRQEAFVVIARVFRLDAADTAELDRFGDRDSIAAWAAPEIAALVKGGYVQGDNGNLRPTDTITRAEFCQLLYNVICQYVSSAQDTESLSEGNIVIRAAGLTLHNKTVTGDLVAGDGIGAGTLNLNSVTIGNRLLVRGGGTSTVTLSDTNPAGGIVVFNPNSTVLLVTNTKQSVLSAQTNVILQGKFGTVTVSPDAVVTVKKGSSVDRFVFLGGATEAKNVVYEGGGTTGGGGGGGITVVTKYTLTFNTNGGSAIASAAFNRGAVVNLASYVPTRAGYTFAGWYADAALTQGVTSVTMNQNATVYAKWEKYYTLQIDANKGGDPIYADISTLRVRSQEENVQLYDALCRILNNNRTALSNAFTQALAEMQNKGIIDAAGNIMKIPTEMSITQIEDRDVIVNEIVSNMETAGILDDVKTAIIASNPELAGASDNAIIDEKVTQVIEALEDSNVTIDLNADQGAAEVVKVLCDKAESVAGKTDAEIQQKVDDYRDTLSPAMQAALDSLTVQELRDAAADYGQQLRDMLTSQGIIFSGARMAAPRAASSIKMTVYVDAVGSAISLYDQKLPAARARAAEYIDMTGASGAAYSALEAASDPRNFVEPAADGYKLRNMSFDFYFDYLMDTLDKANTALKDLEPAAGRSEADMLQYLADRAITALEQANSKLGANGSAEVTVTKDGAEAPIAAADIVSMLTALRDRSGDRAVTIKEWVDGCGVTRIYAKGVLIANPLGGQIGSIIDRYAPDGYLDTYEITVSLIEE